jgi:hypothetical protein
MNLKLSAILNVLKPASFLLFILFFTILKTQDVFASENFSTSYKVIYDVKESEITRVTLNVGLTNKSSDFYAASYGVQTGFEDIKNINVSDSSGPLLYKTEKNDNGVQVSFDFNDITVGRGKTQNFSISFDTEEISKNYGTVREVNIPGLANQEEFSAFNVEVRVPDNFGKPNIVKPLKGAIDGNNITFNKADLGSGGISIAYGDFQTYQFNLKYHITNKNVFPELTEIALPPDTNYQKVSIDKIDPKPENVIIDEDGNWLARFKLMPSQDLTVAVKGSARVSYKPKAGELTDIQKNLYLKPHKYWEANNSQIQKLANELKTPDAIYSYVIDNLKYDTNRIAQSQVRLGALNVLNNPDSAVCLEFTDLFVALARAAGIPARAVEGYANTSNTSYRPLSLVEDVLHAWPQYWDEKRNAWIMIDPTWENTTKGIDYFNVFDFDHLTFVIKGAESDYPIPAGGYKSNVPKEQKDVYVITAAEYEESKPSLNVTTDFSRNLYGGLPLTGNLVVENDSSTMTPAQNFTVEVEGLAPGKQDLFIDEIPPYGKKVIPIKFDHVGFLTNNTYKAKISIGQDVLVKGITIVPIYRSIYFSYLLGGILAGILLVIISFIIYRSRRIHFPK